MAANSTSTNVPHFYSLVSIIMTLANICTRMLLTLPLYTLLLYLGHQRWQQRRSSSHSDIFTYHAAAMNLIWVLGCFCFFCGVYASLPDMVYVGACVNSIIYYGETLFHVLTCVERYLAVVHPVIYLGLKNERGARIRNISIACVWLLSFGSVGVTALYLPNLPIIPYFCLSVSSLIVVSFCSLSVLCVLNRPGPGDGGGKKDQSKQRAFHTITAILVTLVLWLVGLIVSFSLYSSSLLNTDVGYVVLSCAGWCNLPCSLVLPLLYLHRAGKLSFLSLF